MLKDGAYDDTQLMQAIRRSLRGKASELMINMCEDSVPDLLTRFDGMFGNVLPIEVLLERFYSARQQVGELPSTWACRLEQLVGQIQERDPSISKETRRGMLKTKFWSGLCNDTLKNSLRFKYDSTATYEELVVAARTAVAESDQNKSKSVGKLQQVSAGSQEQTDPVCSRLDNLLKEFKDMKSQVARLENNQAGSSAAGSSATTTNFN